LDFVQKRENVRPIAIFRIDGEFLLCYDEFAFYVNKNGWRARSNWHVQWEGHPTAFALRRPFVLAFEPTFVEIRHVESGALMQIVQMNNMRCIFSDTPPSVNSLSNLPYTGPPAYGYASPYPQHQPQYARHSTYGGQYVMPPMRPPLRGVSMPTGSRSHIIMSADGGATVLRIRQVA